MIEETGAGEGKSLRWRAIRKMGSAKIVETCQKTATPQISVQTIGVTSLRLSHGIKLAERDFGKQSSRCFGERRGTKGGARRMKASICRPSLPTMPFISCICFPRVGTVMANEKPNGSHSSFTPYCRYLLRQK